MGLDKQKGLVKTTGLVKRIGLVIGKGLIKVVNLLSGFYQWIPNLDTGDNRGTGGSNADVTVISGSVAGEDLVLRWPSGDAGLFALSQHYGLGWYGADLNTPLDVDLATLSAYKCYPQYNFDINKDSNNINSLNVNNLQHIFNTIPVKDADGYYKFKDSIFDTVKTDSKYYGLYLDNVSSYLQLGTEYSTITPYMRYIGDILSLGSNSVMYCTRRVGTGSIAGGIELLIGTDKKITAIIYEDGAFKVNYKTPWTLDNATDIYDIEFYIDSNKNINIKSTNLTLATAQKTYSIQYTGVLTLAGYGVDFGSLSQITGAATTKLSANIKRLEIGIYGGQKSIFEFQETIGFYFNCSNGTSLTAYLKNGYVENYKDAEFDELPPTITRGCTRFLREYDNAELLIPYKEDFTPSQSVKSGYIKDADYPADSDFIKDLLATTSIQNQTNVTVLKNQAARFNGTDNLITTNVESEIGSADFRMSFYIKVNPVLATQYIIERWAESTDKCFRIYQNINGTIGVDLSADGSAHTTITTTATVDDNEWHRFEIFKAQTTAWLLIDEQKDSQHTVPASLYANGLDVIIGDGFEGDLSEIQIDKSDMIIDVYIKTGQSNDAGYPRGFGDLPVGLQSEFIHHFHSDNLYYPTKNINNGILKPYSSLDWGSEITFGYEMWKKYRRKIAIVKVSRDATSIDAWAGATGYMKTAIIDAYNSVLSNLQSKGYTPVFKKLIFDQGEADSQSLSNANNWLTLFDDFTTRLSSSLNITVEGNIIIRKLSVKQNPEGYIYSNIVRNSQETVGNRPGNILINSDDFHLYTDNVHFDSYGLIPYGEKIAEECNFNQINNAWLNQELHENIGTTAYSLMGTPNGVISGTLTNFRDATIDIVEPKALTKGASIYSNGLVLPYDFDGNPIVTSGLTLLGNYTGGIMKYLSNYYKWDVNTVIAAVLGEPFYTGETPNEVDFDDINTNLIPKEDFQMTINEDGSIQDLAAEPYELVTYLGIPVKYAGKAVTYLKEHLIT